ncbi:MAG: sigma-70 family RNA polymerase sigma factor [Phycisphaerae bacterium]|nr:sigma-70 family RNA polymerase sigma factor [Phycisphaerae bacterium]
MDSTDRDSNLRASALSTVMGNRAVTPGQMDEEAARRLDAEDVSRTLAGDTTAYDRLIEKYQRRAVAVAYRLLGNIEDAMDVCQDAYLRAFRSLASLQQAELFCAWLMRIVTNLSLNYRRGRRPSLSLATQREDSGSTGQVIDVSPAENRTPAESLQGVEARQAITAAIESLPDQQRLALILFAIEGLPQKEVAEILECSVEMVKWNVFQARRKLKERLAEYLED